MVLSTHFRQKLNTERLRQTRHSARYVDAPVFTLDSVRLAPGVQRAAECHCMELTPRAHRPLRRRSSHVEHLNRGQPCEKVTGQVMNVFLIDRISINNPGMSRWRRRWARYMWLNHRRRQSSEVRGANVNLCQPTPCQKLKTHSDLVHYFLGWAPNSHFKNKNKK